MGKGKKRAERGRSVKRKAEKDNAGQKIARPRGYSTLLSYTAVVALLYILMGFFSDIGLFFGIITGRASTLLVNLVMACLTLAVLYGLYSRKAWSYRLSLSLYAASAASSLFSIVLYGVWRHHIISSVSSVIVPSLILIFFMNLLTFWYVRSHRRFLLEGRAERTNILREKLFILCIYLFYMFLFIFIFLTVLSFFISAKSGVDMLSLELGGKSIDEAYRVCESKAGEDRDLCILMLVVHNSEERTSELLCGEIGTDFYRFTCSMVVENA